VSGETAKLPEPAAQARYDLEELQALSQRDRACDETVKARVTQDDIRKLMSRRRAKGPA
jgi:hypothetical protein